MSIIRGRIHFSDNFTIMSNSWARDGRLTLRARGLLLQLLSHREGWTLTVDQLVRANPEGKHAIQKALKELQDHGYLKREQARGAGAQFGNMDYILMDPEENAQVAPLTDSQSTAEQSHKNTNPKNTNVCYDDSAESSTGATTGRAPSRNSPEPKRDKWGVLETERRTVREYIMRAAQEPYGSEAYDEAFRLFLLWLGEVYGEDIAGYAENKWSIHPSAASAKGAGKELNTLISTAISVEGLNQPKPCR